MVAEKDAGGRLTMTYAVLRSLLAALVLTAFFLLVISILYLTTDLNEAACRGFVTASAIASVFLASFFGARSLSKRGLFLGALCGALYALFLYLTGFLAFGFPGFHRGLASTLALCLLSGAFGGVAGVNMRPPKRK